MNERNCIFNKYNLASFLCQEYKDKYNKDISPIKLQKGMYFLFASWGGKILAAHGEGLEDTEDDETFESITPYLFDADFRAWKYGPVEHDVYIWFKHQNKEPFDPELKALCNKEYENEIVHYVKEYALRVFATSDFGLVDLSHEDECWKKSALLPNTEMNCDDILKEYASR